MCMSTPHRQLSHQQVVQHHQQHQHVSRCWIMQSQMYLVNLAQMKRKSDLKPHVQNSKPISPRIFHCLTSSCLPTDKKQVPKLNNILRTLMKDCGRRKSRHSRAQLVTLLQQTARSFHQNLFRRRQCNGIAGNCCVTNKLSQS